MERFKDKKTLIQTAILNEKEGAEFYKMAALQFRGPEIKEMFLVLAKEEERHINYLRAEFGAHGEHKEEIDVPSPQIFSGDMLQKESIDLAVSVFGMAINMEKASVEFYEAALAHQKDTDMAPLLKKLVVWEKNHLETFQAQYDLLKQDWWAEQDFAPF